MENLKLLFFSLKPKSAEAFRYWQALLYLKRSISKVSLLLMVCFLPTLLAAQSDGLPRGASEMPYTRYEAEDGNRGGGAIFHETTTFDETKIAAEASNQKYVGLPSNGSFVEWTVNEPGDGITLRFNMPDSPTGEGENGALDIYVNGNMVKTIDITSYWAYQYFPGSEPENDPSDRPRMRFDETHFMLNTSLASGDVLKIQKNNGDAFEYGVDFVEIESVPAPIAKPAGYVSVTDFGAIPDDGQDDLPAFQAALTAAGNAGTGLYIPPGTFTLNDKWIVEENGIGIIGAGIWHTNLFFSNKSIFSGGIMARASEIEIAHFYMNTANNRRFYSPGNYMIYKGLMGTYGNNSSLHNLWVTHFECGAWIGGYDPPYPIDITSNLTFANNRIRNNYADGINFCQGTNNSTVTQCNFRSNGDDAMACWPNSDFSAPMGVNNIYKFSTIEHNYRAGGAAIFGGDGHEVHHCLFKDGMGSSAIRLTTDFPGYHFENATQIRFYENTIIACGTSNDLWNAERGAIEINATNYPIKNIFFENIDIINSHRHAIQIGSNQSVDAYFDNISINGTGLDGETEATYTQPLEGAAIMTFTGSGSATFNNLSLENIALDPPTYEARPGFNLIIQNVDIPLTGVTLSKSTMPMTVGEEAVLTVAYSPTNASNKSVIWSSSNPSVATYDPVKEKVIAHGIGSAVITVTSQEGNFTDNVTVNVSAAVSIKATEPNASEDGDVGIFVIETTSLSGNINVKYTISGTASADDYVASPELTGSVTLTPSKLSQTITIAPVDDDEFEGDETLILTLVADESYKLGKEVAAIITIRDNDAPPCTSPSIVFTNVAISIDQNIDDAWSNAPSKSIAIATIGSAPNDFFGQWRAMYDENNLYVLVESSAENLNNDSGDEWWNDDVIEIFIDGDNSKGTSYDGLNDFQYAFRWDDPVIKIGQNSVSKITGVNFSMYATTIGYNLEVAIPWGTIGVTPQLGAQIGFDVVIDGDTNGGSRDYQVSSFATTDMAWADPSLFGSVYLTACNGIVSSIAEENNEGAFHSLNIYPNPLKTGNLSVNYNGKITPDATLLFYDLTGRLIYQQKLVDTVTTVDKERFVSGIYFIKLISGEVVLNKKVLIE